MASTPQTATLTTTWRNLPAAAGVSASAVVLFGVQNVPLGLVVLLASLGLAWFTNPALCQDLLLIGLGLTIVASTSVKADVSWPRFFQIGTALGLAVLVPFLVDRFIYRRKVVHFPWRGGGRWTRAQVGYLALVPLLAYLILPFYFIRSGVYTNWPVITTTSEHIRFFIGVNAVGTWDELFFICTCFALLRRHFRMPVANLLQAVIFVVPVGARLPGLGPVADLPVRAGAGVHLHPHSLTDLRGDCSSVVRRRGLPGHRPRSQPGLLPVLPLLRRHLHAEIGRHRRPRGRARRRAHLTGHATTFRAATWRRCAPADPMSAEVPVSAP